MSSTILCIILDNIYKVVVILDVQLKKGVLDICVLSLLGTKDYYGYELVTELLKHIEISEGTVYPILRKLDSTKYLESYLVESSDGPARKYYKITSLGVKRLSELNDEWLQFCDTVNLIINKGRT